MAHETPATHAEALKAARRNGGRVYEVQCEHGGTPATPDRLGDVTCPCGRVLVVRGGKVPAHAPNHTGSLGWVVRTR